MHLTQGLSRGHTSTAKKIVFGEFQPLPSLFDPLGPLAAVAGGAHLGPWPATLDSLAPAPWSPFNPKVAIPSCWKVAGAGHNPKVQNALGPCQINPYFANHLPYTWRWQACKIHVNLHNADVNPLNHLFAKACMVWTIVHWHDRHVTFHLRNTQKNQAQCPMFDYKVLPLFQQRKPSLGRIKHGTS